MGIKKSSLELILIYKMESKKVLEKNLEVLESYDRCKETLDLIEKINIVLGRKQTFKIETSSTLNFKVTCYGISSTTAQKI
jgi:hypothetical protein